MSCGPDNCYFREKLLVSGKCEKCQDYELVVDGKYCKKPYCTKWERTHKLGFC